MSRIKAADFFRQFDVNQDNALSAQELADVRAVTKAWRQLDLLDSRVVAKAMDLKARRQLFSHLHPAFVAKWDNGIYPDGRFVAAGAGDFFLTIAEQRHADEQTFGRTSPESWPELVCDNFNCDNWEFMDPSVRRPYIDAQKQDLELMRLSYGIQTIPGFWDKVSDGASKVRSNLSKGARSVFKPISVNDLAQQHALSKAPR